ncbi:MAG: cation transporter [Lachnospiraceae bacterium]|nr:cation transporter [Lachnospiraceae bacterium]
MENDRNLDNLVQNRDSVIIKTSVIGILANILLSGAKALFGVLTHSIAILLDAVNNISDALSSVITIVGTKLAGRKPDKKHPLGHGRIEYVSAAIVSAIILYAGITSFIESVKKIITPEVADYSTASIIMLSVAIVVKLILGLYVRKKGEKVRSDTLKASGTDALFDAVISASVLISAVVYLLFKVSLEAWLGVLISAYIIKSGIEMLLETLNELLGKRADRETVEAIKETILKDPEISGVFDLLLHNYGPEKLVGSVHVEVPDTLSAYEIDTLERRVAENVYREHGVIMGAVGIYAHNTKDAEIVHMRERVTEIIMAHEGILQIHGFYADLISKVLKLDIIIDFGVKDREALFEHIQEELRDVYPEFQVFMTLDLDV